VTQPMQASIFLKYVNYITYSRNRVRLIYRKFWIFTQYLIVHSETRTIRVWILPKWIRAPTKSITH